MTAVTHPITLTTRTGAIVRQFECNIPSGSLSVGQIGFVTTDGLLQLAVNAAESTSKGQLALIISGSRKALDGSLIDGETVTAVLFGEVLGFSALVETTQYVLGAAGTLDDTAPVAVGSVTRNMGWAVSPEVFFFNPEVTYTVN